MHLSKIIFSKITDKVEAQKYPKRTQEKRMVSDLFFVVKLWNRLDLKNLLTF